MSDIQEEQIDNDGFLLGDAEQEQTAAQNVLMREIKADTTTIVNLLKGTAKLQRDALKAAQSTASPKPKGGNGNAGSGQSSRVNLLHPNRTTSPTPNNGQGAPIPPTVRPNRQGAGANQPPMPQRHGSGSNTGSPDTARANRQRGANGRATANDTQANDESAQGSGNRDSRGRFTGGNGANATDRSASSRITDGLKDLNNTLTVNANTDRIDPMVDAIKEAGSVIGVGVDAGKKVLSVGNRLIAKPAMALGRGLVNMIKPKDVTNSPTAWYKRIWRTLERGNRQDQTQHNQEQRRLDEIARGQRQRGSADSGLLMMLGLGLAGLLAAFKNIKIPSIDDIKNAIIAASESIKEQAKKSINDLGYDNDSPIAPMSIKPPALRPPQTQPSLLSKAVDWAKDTRAGKAVGWGVRKLPYVSSVLETGAGGVNAYNIDQDQTLTPQQKKLKQAENAGRTGGRIGGGLAGATAGGATALSLTAPTMNPFIIVPSVIGGSILGGIYGADAGGYLGEKAVGGVYKNIVSTPTQRSKKFIEPSAYADRDSEARKLYEEHKRLDVDGSGIITRDEMIKGGRPDLLGEPEKAQTTQKGFTPEKAKSIKATSERLGINPNDLAQIISFETGGTFDPSQKNLAGGSARGLIQFMPSTAKAMGTTTEALAAMTFDEQMVYVEKYLKDRGIGKNGKTSLADMYDVVLGSGYKIGSKEYAANKGVDADKNGVISKGEAVKSKSFQEHAKKYFAELPTTSPKTTAPKANIATSSVPTLKAAPVNAVPVPNVQAVQSVQAKEQPTRHNSTPTPIKVSIAKPLVGQNVSDRGIAHILTGGIGEVV